VGCRRRLAGRRQHRGRRARRARPEAGRDAGD
jgi:hypothetical protein